MPYLLIDDGMAENPKVVGLSDRAFRLWITSLLYCARNMTDGAISELAMRFSAANAKIERPGIVVKQLVSAGLWVPNGTGWQINDYLKYNPSRAETEEKRAKARERKRLQRASGHDGTSQGTSRGSHATQDPRKGVSKETPLATSSPAGSSQRRQALAAAHTIATTWSTPDSDAFATALDKIQLEHSISLGALEREALWDTANASSRNGHEPAAPPQTPALAGRTTEPPAPPGDPT